MRKPYLECNSAAGPQISAAMGLSPRWKYMGLGLLWIYASVAQWRYAIFGLGPVQIYATVGPAPSEALPDGRIYCKYLAPWSTGFPMEPCS